MGWFQKLDDVFKKGAGNIVDSYYGTSSSTKDMEGSITGAENNLKQIPAAIEAPMQILKGNEIKNAIGLRELPASDLYTLLKAAATVMGQFENQIEDLSEILFAQGEYVEAMAQRSGGLLSDLATYGGSARKNAEKKSSHITPQVVAVCDQTYEYFGAKVFPHLGFIPEKFRRAADLFAFCEYIEDGEVDSWESCVKTIKADKKHEEVMTKYEGFDAKLAMIERNTSATARNTDILAFFAITDRL
ncbi:MAG: hypothetical protein FWE32_08150 [Oscillospiraceae bacterium]|nr:hypothetical protein [Oscillospiraceae bacterium]